MKNSSNLWLQSLRAKNFSSRVEPEPKIVESSRATSQGLLNFSSRVEPEPKPYLVTSRAGNEPSLGSEGLYQKSDLD